ncbi:MAG TPA: AMP-binding protein [Alicyclobacillus sp.]|nr:AMP-binding protein [Alicyclobacillus sp.]
MDLATLFEFAAERYPDQEAVVQSDTRLTYRELHNQVHQTAAGLQRIGLKKGDKLLLVLKNRLEMVLLYWAAQMIGAVFTPINFRLSSDEVKYIVHDSAAKAVVYEPASEAAVKDALSGLEMIKIGVQDPGGVNYSLDELRSCAGVPDRPKIADDDIALMLYTSGTTGRPKGVPRTHLNEYSAAMAHIIQNKYERHESTVGVMPLYHTMGMRSLLSTAFLNGKIVMLPDYDTLELLRILEREKVTCIYLVPTIIHDIVNHPDFEKFNLSLLKKLGYAGAAMTKALTEQCFAKLHPNVFVNHYGSTEVYTYATCDYLDKKPACAGKPGFHQRIRVVAVNAGGRSSPDDVVPVNTPGEIIVDIRSNESFQGYWNRPDATEKAIRDGWYFTGDIGKIDEDGDLYVLGRVDDMIISGGENIHPLEVEDVLAKHPKVSEVAVVGLPDDRWGEIVAAFVVPRDPSLTPEELDQYCKESERLSNFKRPRKYIMTDSLPKSPVGKILRRKLRTGTYSTITEESVS